LSDYEIRGTFYVVADAVRGSLPEWRNAIEAGHEIGNHTHRHPCCRALGVSETVLEDYSIEEIEKDIRTASWEIADLLQVEPRSFAYPCGNAFVGRGPTRQSYVPLVAGMFQSGRGYPHAEANDPLHCNFEYLKSAKLDDVSYEVADRLIGEALQSGGWLIFTGHETPADDEILPALLRRVSEDSAVWADTVGTIADYVLATR
jgi:peptidoglycan/xylan/chitin deacetylase (PgdA/CDA1 family)